MSAMRWRSALQLSGGLSSLISHSQYTPLLLSSQLCISSVANSIVSARTTGPLTPHASYSTWPKEPWLCPASVSNLRSLHTSTNPSQTYLTYKISASYSAKGQRLDPERNIFSHNRFVRTKRTVEGKNGEQLSKSNRPKSGQDSFFVGQVGDVGSIAFGVVDGVGGWADSGVDPADFAHSLCDYMAVAANNYPEGLPEGPLHPKELLQVGYQRVMEDSTIHAGGSTACVGVLDPDGQMEVANLGDSGFVHFGPNSVRYVSEAQTHAFNTPYQLSKVPKRMQAQMSLFGGQSALADAPKDAHVSKHKLAHGDVLVFASDGVWDNLSPQDTLTIVSRYMLDLGAWTDTAKGIHVNKNLASLTGKGALAKSDSNTVQSIVALAVTKEAKEASLNTRRDGPFAREVHKYYPGENWHGGKPDDICVVVVIAVDPNASSVL